MAPNPPGDDTDRHVQAMAQYGAPQDKMLAVRSPLDTMSPPR